MVFLLILFKEQTFSSVRHQLQLEETNSDLGNSQSHPTRIRVRVTPTSTKEIFVDGKIDKHKSFVSQNCPLSIFGKACGFSRRRGIIFKVIKYYIFNESQCHVNSILWDCCKKMICPANDHCVSIQSKQTVLDKAESVQMWKYWFGGNASCLWIKCAIYFRFSLTKKENLWRTEWWWMKTLDLCLEDIWRVVIDLHMTMYLSTFWFGQTYTVKLVYLLPDKRSFSMFSIDSQEESKQTKLSVM